MDAILLQSKLPPFEGREIKLIEEQTVGDIIPELIKTHYQYASDYDKIAPYFVGRTVQQTLRNCWNFLKANVKYKIEGVDRQKLCSPSAIIALGNVGLDCKNYALFIAGICGAVNRLGLQKFPFCFRFASYRLFDKTPQHVFLVAYPGTSSEIWCDPVLKAFNWKKKYTYAKDSSNMALYRISGIEQSGQVGFIKKLAKKVGGAPTRGAFLALISLNAFGLAKKLAEAYDTDKNALIKWWVEQGGKRTPLERAIRKGRKKRRLFGIDEPELMGAIYNQAITPAQLRRIALQHYKRTGRKFRRVKPMLVDVYGDQALGALYDDITLAYEGNRQIGVAPAVLAAKAAKIIRSFTKFFKRLSQIKKLKKLQAALKKTKRIRDIASRVKSAAVSVKELAQSAPTKNELQ